MKDLENMLFNQIKRDNKQDVCKCAAKGKPKRVNKIC